MVLPCIYWTAAECSRYRYGMSVACPTASAFSVRSRSRGGAWRRHRSRCSTLRLMREARKLGAWRELSGKSGSPKRTQHLERDVAGTHIGRGAGGSVISAVCRYNAVERCASIAPVVRQHAANRNTGIPDTHSTSLYAMPSLANVGYIEVHLQIAGAEPYLETTRQCSPATSIGKCMSDTLPAPDVGAISGKVSNGERCVSRRSEGQTQRIRY